jgi:hypothetical protein
VQFVDISSLGKTLLAQVDVREAKDPRVLATTADGREMIGCGERRFTQLMDAGEIDSVVEGGSRRPVVASIYALIRRRIIASHPAGKLPVKVHDGRGIRKALKRAAEVRRKGKTQQEVQARPRA